MSRRGNGPGPFYVDPASPGNVTYMPDGSRRFTKPAAALGVLATMASIWWFALRPRRKLKGGAAPTTDEGPD